MSRYAIYRMVHNTYLQDCLALVYRPTKEEIQRDGLQSPFLLLLLRSKRNLADVRTPSDLARLQIFDTDQPILLRLGSECLFGTFGDSHCDCEPQRVASLREIASIGQGIYAHLPQEAQGNGIFYKAKELQLQVSGLDPNGLSVGQRSVTEAARILLKRGEELDKRRYTSLQRVFRETGLSRYPFEVISQNPEKSRFLRQELGITIGRARPAPRIVTADNAGEYLAKVYSKSFTLTDSELEDIYFALLHAKEIPGRVLRLLRQIEEDLSLGRQFASNTALLRQISGVERARGLQYQHVQDLQLFKDTSAYDEYQIELAIAHSDVKELFAAGILLNDTSLRYEENHFYDLAFFDEAPARSVKIRYAYRVNNRSTPDECRFIYKIPIREDTYRIKAVQIGEEVAQLLALTLQDYERHVLPVFTHNVSSPQEDLTVLLKRYAPDLRTVSIMGAKQLVSALKDRISRRIKTQKISDPTTFKYIDRRVSLGFDYDAFKEEELSLFRSYTVG